jgi:hypothetical protein
MSGWVHGAAAKTWQNRKIIGRMLDLAQGCMP